MHISLGEKIWENEVTRGRRLPMKAEEKKIKKELMIEAEIMIDELLEWDEKNNAPTMTEIEDIVLELRKRMSEKMAQAIVGNQEQKQPVPGPTCSQCRKEMRNKGQKGNEVESRVGQIRVERGYYYCPKCKEGSFPPG